MALDMESGSLCKMNKNEVCVFRKRKVPCGKKQKDVRYWEVVHGIRGG